MGQERKMATTKTSAGWRKKRPEPTAGERLARSLAEAAARGDADRIDELLKLGATPRLWGDSELILAVGSRHLAAVKALLPKPGDKNRQSQLDRALREAARLCDETLILALLEEGADPSGPGKAGMTVLMLAAVSCESAAVEALAKRCDVNAATDEDGETALMVAALHGRAASVEVLLAAGADPSASTADSERTALHMAAMSREARCAALLSPLSDLDKRDCFGETAEEIAAKLDFQETLAALRQERARRERVALADVAEEAGSKARESRKPRAL
jgi:uncharacterized protein